MKLGHIFTKKVIIPNCLIDLHLHLDGSLSVSTVRRLAAMQGIAVPEADADIKKLISLDGECRDLNEYLSKFGFAVSLLQTKEAISEAVYRLKEELLALGFIYAEIRFAPQRHCEKGLTQEDAVLAAIEGSKRSALKSNLILCCMRDAEESVNRETVEVAGKYLGKGVCAIDLAGAEALYPTENFKYVYDRARFHGLHMTVHCGEAAGPESVKQALRFEPERLGHGVRSYTDPWLLKKLIALKVAFELCPTSNLHTSIFPELSAYPLRRLMDAGALVTVNSDNMSVSDTNVRVELEKLVETFGLKKNELKQLMENSARVCFADDAAKKELLETIEKAFA